jgi:hypothetical protein
MISFMHFLVVSSLLAGAASTPDFEGQWFTGTGDDSGVEYLVRVFALRFRAAHRA